MTGSSAKPESQSVLHYFVDEAGDPILFNGKGHLLVGTEGCSSFFILGKLDVGAPVRLAEELEQLRAELLADPYFKKVPSMQPEQKKTALAFHAKDDMPEVRREVFKLLMRHDLRFYAVVRDKRELAAYVRQRNERDPQYRYKHNELYDTLVQELFRKLHRMAEQLHICFSKRGAKDRTDALKAALQNAECDFEKAFGFSRQSTVKITAATPAENAGLQAVDYFMWALQRFYERGENRYIEMLWPHVGEIHDLDFIEDGLRGVFFGKNRPLTSDVRPTGKQK